MITWRHILIVVFTVISIAFRSSAQATDAKTLLADSLNDCSEIQYASMQLIPLFYQDGIVDTANMLLDCWARKCGTDETIFRTKILWAIDAGTFSDDLFGDEVVQYLDTYQWLYNDTTGDALGAYYYYTPEFELLKWYKAFTDSITARALRYTDLSAEESFFVHYYAHPTDSLFLLLTTRGYAGTKLEKIFKSPVNGELPRWNDHYSLSTGVWGATDKLSLVGFHPVIGGEIGYQKNRTIVNFGLDLSIGYAKEKYKVLYQGQVYDSDNFMEMSIHMDLGRQLIVYRRCELDVLGSIGFEVMNVLNLSDATVSSEDSQSKFLRSPGLGFGASYLYYLKNGRFIGLKGKYNFLNFNNEGGTNLRGNSYIITFEYGFGTNQWLNNRNTYLNNRIKPFLKSS